MIPLTLQFIIMALGFMALGALIYRFCCAGCSGACSDCSDCDGCNSCSVPTPKAAVKAMPAATVVANAAASMKRDDDLVIIEGIGPAIKKVLNANGVHTFAHVATTPKETIHKWLEAAGPQFRMHDASTWAEQAILARDGKMAELEMLKVKLSNGQHA